MCQKTCFKCGEVKPLSDFYKHKGMADGHLNKCKVCTKKDTAKYTKDNPKKTGEYKKQWARRNSTKRAAHIIVGNAIRDGHLIRPDKCENCGCSSNLQAHHDNYMKPLDVRWLCVACHSDWHNHNTPIGG